MRKKAYQILYIILFVALSSGVILTAAGFCYAQDFNRMYLGAAGEMTHYNLELDNDASVEGISADGPAVGVFGGFGMMVNPNTYFGMEANVGIHSADSSLKVDNYTGEADIEETFGLSGRVGYVLDNWLIYGLLGVQSTKIDVNAEYEDPQGDIYGVSDDNNFNGVRIGTGVEYQTDRNAFFRSEYSYTMYDEETLRDNGYYVDVEPRAGKIQFAVGSRF